MKGRTMPSETMYDDEGRAYHYVQTLDDGKLLVRRLSQCCGDEYDDPIYGELLAMLPGCLMESPPVQVADQKVAEARKTLEGLKRQIRESRQAIRDTEAGAAKVMERLKRHKGLEQLDRFLENGITHYVEVRSWGVPNIVAFEDATCDYEPRDLKLLTLYGKSDGCLQWRLNKYRDGSSGSDVDVYPHTSYEAALEDCQRLIAAHELEALNPECHRCPSDDWVAFAAKYGLFISDDYKTALQAAKDAARRDAISKAKAKLAELEDA